jgi:hypothetical protein
MERTKNCLLKLERMNKTLRHEEPDRVPISDFFWGSFVKRWRSELNLPPDANPHDYYDLDWIVTTPNMDPKIQSFETIREDETEVVVKTGFLTTMRKKFDFPMPEFMSWEIDTIEKLEAFEFDDPMIHAGILKPAIIKLRELAMVSSGILLHGLKQLKDCVPIFLFMEV